MNTLCIDIGTKLGWAIDLGGYAIESGSVNLSATGKQGYGGRYVNLRKWLANICDTWRIDNVVFEDVKAHKGVDAAHVYGGYLAIIQEFFEVRGIPYSGVGVGTIKKHATGKGNATKGMMVDAAISKGHNPADDNEADAIAIAYCSRDLA
jgi:Holliday junction resolvasome RuvABC endonuclease subunit